ncbi:MAG TPA: hypothetical protein VMT93_03960 [Gemmatimonadaceae bacterium]|nr:hypothetical protein [Gemmatimonadaceae bacterium]
MFRTIMGVGVLAIIGIIAMKLVFGIFGLLVGWFFVLLFVALKIAFVGLLVYLVIRVLSPDTARKIKEGFSNS